MQVDAYNQKRSLRHIKRHLVSAPVDVRVPERGTGSNETGGVTQLLDRIKDETEGLGFANAFSKLSSSEDAGPPKWYELFSRL